MTKPTQAQIEAAARAIDEDAFFMPDDLTPSERMYWEANKPVKQGLARQKAMAALAAAAEVGHIDPIVNSAIDASVAVAKASTIERCAQVVKEREKGSGRNLSDVVEAIRALKDKP